MRGPVCLLLILSILVLPPSGARADHLADLAARYEGGEPMALHAAMKVNAFPGLEGEMLDRVNLWLSQSGITVSSALGEGEQTDHALMVFDGTNCLDVWVRTAQEGALTLFTETGRAYRTGAGEHSFLASMAGEGVLPVVLPGWQQVFSERLVPRFYELLESRAEEAVQTESRVKVKNAGTSELQTVYTLSADGMNALWPAMTSFFSACSGALAAFPVPEMQKALLCMEGITFTDTAVFTRLYDSGGRDMGLKVSGRSAPGDGSERKLSLTAAFCAEGGGYFYLSMPAVRGELTDKWVLSAAVKQTASRLTVTVEGSFDRTDSEGKIDLDLSGTWKDVYGDEDTITCKASLSGRIRGIRKGWTVKGEITARESGAEGNVLITASTAGNTDTGLDVSLSLFPCGETVMPEAAEEKDLSLCGEAERETLLLREMLPALRVWLYHMDALTVEERALIAHILRDGEWMNGPVTVGPAEGTTLTEKENEWSVEEEQ